MCKMFTSQCRQMIFFHHHHHHHHHLHYHWSSSNSSRSSSSISSSNNSSNVQCELKKRKRDSYWVRDGCSAIIFLKHVKTSSNFCHNTQISAEALIVALLWELPQMPSCRTNNANLDNYCWHVLQNYNIDCCAAIHGQIWVNHVPN